MIHSRKDIFGNMHKDVLSLHFPNIMSQKLKIDFLVVEIHLYDRII